ncbi:MAG: nicotinate phosphoribosyltransferase [Calditrichaeota bacterium]|nr:MAG: nicotinate phosphoribosyltransferase [Calditrichota bacterium]MBL1205259.1 nicotinate phosphoribosyltransferase [Calditrichota bacterium]NOG45088.1 nicotinate phosphoribosyltransferase [Calditrichota bacterium]
MNTLKSLYKTSLSLLTDYYQLNMAYGFWKSGKAETESVFGLYFRKNPFNGGFTIAAGLANVIDYMQNFKFSEDDIAYLATLSEEDGSPVFEKAFLNYLTNLKCTCEIDAIPEGTVVFPHEPLLRIRGPIIQAQLLETPLLNLVNFQSLIATKAARVCISTQGEPVLEFGLRRAHGIDGGLAVSRAAYIGGCAATSNVLAGKVYDIPVKGTHAHSWIMTFDSEMESFEAYAKAMPKNCVFLVDTYDTIEGIKNAIEMGRKLRNEGHEMLGIRLDSGDLAYLSIEARKMLDDAGFEKANIYASNDLDENIIQSLKDQGAKINVWGVGTKLVTAYDQPALGGVYKLSALKNNNQWSYKLKLSEQAIKVSNPGILQVRRYSDYGEYVGDAIYDTRLGITEDCTIVDPIDFTRRKKFDNTASHKDLLIPVFKNGECVYDSPDIHSIRKFAQKELQSFHRGIKRFVNPHQYPVGLEKNLHDLKSKLVLKARGLNNQNS